MSSKNFKTLYISDTGNNADSVEWCPISPYRTSFACGTYHLVEGNKPDEENGNACVRTGGIIIYTICKDQLEKNCSVDCPAVLDMKWCNEKVNNDIVLAAANAAGEVAVYTFKNYMLKLLSKCSIKTQKDYLILALDWTKQNLENLICCSDSKGNISLIKFLNNSLSIIKEWNGHLLEAWTVCFDSFQNNIIYSGGDEGVFKMWDTRKDNSAEVMSSKTHVAGVTVLNSSLFDEFTLVSGGYDENVFFWDTRNWKSPLKAITASGGLWRLKWHPSGKLKFLLAACIYGGFQVYDLSSYKSISEYKEHESMAYGADWCSLNHQEVEELLGCRQSSLIATCSFYDRKLCVSTWSEVLNE